MGGIRWFLRCLPAQTTPWFCEGHMDPLSEEKNQSRMPGQGGFFCCFYSCGLILYQHSHLCGHEAGLTIQGDVHWGLTWDVAFGDWTTAKDTSQALMRSQSLEITDEISLVFNEWWQQSSTYHQTHLNNPNPNSNSIIHSFLEKSLSQPNPKLPRGCSNLSKTNILTASLLSLPGAQTATEPDSLRN